jgi:hypothetical protein
LDSIDEGMSGDLAVRRSSTRRLLLVSLAVLGGACSPGALSTPGEEAQTQVAVSVVEVGRGVDAEKRIDRPVESFFPEDPIYVSVTTRGRGRAALTARFILTDGRVVHEDTQHILPDGTAITEFHVMNPAGWPTGTHHVEILVDGRLRDTRTFTVRQRSTGRAGGLSTFVGETKALTLLADGGRVKVRG